MLFVAANDYASARCLLLNGLMPGLVMGAQAVEKFLKAYLLFADPSRSVRKLSHSLPTLLQGADSLYPDLRLSNYASRAEKFRQHYQARYPDNPDQSKLMTTADLHEFDELIIFLNENMPCNVHAKYRTGLYAMFTGSLARADGFTWPAEIWVKRANRALAPLLPSIAVEHQNVMNALYPQIQMALTDADVARWIARC